jgi:polysaccharide deacetylase family protein (PEP-CTERM system associated)
MLLLSFDIEEWFLTNDPEAHPIEQWQTFTKRVEDNTNKILALLAEKKRKATFFVLGWVAGHYPDLIREIINQGHELGYHSYYHFQVYKTKPKDFEADLSSGLELLEKITGTKTTAYRAPYFSINDNVPWALPLLIRYGIEVDSSIIAKQHFQQHLIPEKPVTLELNEGNITEFPLSRFNLFGYDFCYTGSGYFRMLPKQFITRNLNNKAYTLLYFHPRDFDANTPWHPTLSFNRNLMNRVGGGGTLRKLGQILDQFPSKSLGEAKEHLIKSQTPIPVIKLIQ